MTSLPPGIILIFGALLLPFLPSVLRKVGLVGLPVLSFAHLWMFPEGYTWQMQLFGEYTLTPIRVDALSLVWGYVFHLAAFISAIYALHVKSATQHVSALMYAGAAIAAVFAGDFISLFVAWELTAITSVFLIWTNPTEQAYRTGMRYLIIQVGSGVLLLAGVLLYYQSSGSIVFDQLAGKTVHGDVVSSLWDAGIGVQLILLAFGIKAAFPFLHNWLQDSYPQATVTGTVWLSAFTTKLAIYALARSFGGLELLIPIGVAMTLFPIFFAVIENDLRRVLAYSLNNQLGYMVVGVGIGTELSLNGTASHAFAHILYKGLLFMAMGAVLHRVGTIKASELGGLYKSMPLTAVFCIIGSLSISGFPGFSGFVSKSMILTAGAEAHLYVVSLLLLVASAGVVDHSGIKIPFFAFFAHDSGKRVKEAPWNMLVAMGIAAAFCIGIGVYPDALYEILPYSHEATEYRHHVFSSDHIWFSLQLLLFAALAFVIMMKTGIYPPEIRSVNLDTDWVYRKAIPAFGKHVIHPPLALLGAGWKGVMGWRDQFLEKVGRIHGPSGPLGNPWTTGSTTMWAAVLLALYLLLYYLT
jgi:multicomponent Na+:H+ antiporter subunit D